MPDRPDWTYGTILVNRRARIMFLGWDKERQRMLGGGQPWFKAMKLDAGRPAYYPASAEVGDVANFTPHGWKVEEVPLDLAVRLGVMSSLDELRKAAADLARLSANHAASLKPK